MKVEKSKKDKFVPIVITLETEKEFKYLLGLTNQTEGDIKEDAADFDEDIDEELYQELSQFE